MAFEKYRAKYAAWKKKREIERVESAREESELKQEIEATKQEERDTIAEERKAAKEEQAKIDAEKKAAEREARLQKAREDVRKKATRGQRFKEGAKKVGAFLLHELDVGTEKAVAYGKKKYKESQRRPKHRRHTSQFGLARKSPRGTPHGYGWNKRHHTSHSRQSHKRQRRSREIYFMD